MIIQAARLGAANLFSPASRSALWKSLGLTLLILAGLWFGLEQAFGAFIMPWFEEFLPGLPAWAGWIGIVAGIIAGIGLALALGMLIAPVTALVAGLFLDDIAEVIERRDYPSDPPGRAMPMGEAMVQSVKFLLIVVLGNIVALLMLLIPGVNLAAFFLVNGYLLGREYYEFAAMRFMTPAEARRLRSRNSLTVFGAGLVIAGFLSVPFLNLLTPIFAAGLMVHLYKMTSARSGEGRSRSPAVETSRFGRQA